MESSIFSPQSSVGNRQYAIGKIKKMENGKLKMVNLPAGKADGKW